MAEKKQEADVSAADEAHVDRVFAVSRHADGTPAQSPGFKSVDPEATKAISEHQLHQQAASAVDYAARTALLEEQAADETKPDKWIQSLKDAQEKAGASAAKKAESLSK